MSTGKHKIRHLELCAPVAPLLQQFTAGGISTCRLGSSFMVVWTLQINVNYTSVGNNEVFY